jgi:hypothetical protein
VDSLPNKGWVLCGKILGTFLENVEFCSRSAKDKSVFDKIDVSSAAFSFHILRKLAQLAIKSFHETTEFN